MKRYPTYKDSGIEWIGNVPSDWQVNRLKTFCFFTYGDSLANEDRVGGTIPVYGSNGIVGYHNKAITHKPCIVIGRKGSYGKVNFSQTECFPIDTTYFVDDRSAKCDLKWLNYILPLLELDKFSKDTGIPGLNREDAHNKRVPIPETYVQKSIAKYLDRKTAQINDLIAKKERMIELLKEERTAIINQAVTKSLNYKAEMKDSGTEWLGKIPKHWEVKKLKYLVHGKLEYGANEVAELDYQELPRYIRITDFDDDGNLREDTFKSLSEDKAREYLLNEGDILFARSGATVGKTFQFKNYAGKACFAGYLIKARPNEEILLSDFLYYYTRSNAYENWKNSIFNQATIQNIGADKYSVLPLPLPSVAEQKGIVNFIIVKCKRIGGIISRGQQSLELLKEYRTFLISEVVTGKIDVRECVA